MPKMTECALRKRDKARDLGAELLASVCEMKAGRAGHVHHVAISAMTEARTRAGFSSRGIRRGIRSKRRRN
jgi:putative transcriptional regulator